MERRIPQKQVEIPGAFLTRLTTDGYSVARRHEYIGYLHASVGDRFNVYQRKVDEMEYRLGKKQAGGQHGSHLGHSHANN